MSLGLLRVIRRSKVIHADDTTVLIQSPGANTNEWQGKKILLPE